MFNKMEPLYKEFTTTNGSKLIARGKGEITIYSPNLVTIENVYYCPDSQWNLISGNWLLANGMQFKYPNSKGRAYKQANIVCQGKHIFQVEFGLNQIPRIINDKPILAVTRESNKHRHWQKSGVQIQKLLE